MHWLVEKIGNLQNGSRPIPPAGEDSSVYDGPIWPYLLVYKVWYVALVLILIWQCPEMNRDAFFGNMAHWPRVGEILFGSYLSTWDGAHYMSIAEQGYIPGSPSCAFWPLWPFLMRMGSYLLGGNWSGSCVVSGMILSNVFSYFGFIWMHKLVEMHFGRRLANRTLLLVLFFPGSLFYQFLYTESLFLFLLTGMWLALENRNWAVAYILGLLLALCRPTGAFLLLPLTWYLFVCVKDRKELSVGMQWFLITTPIQGYLLYLFCMLMETNNAFEAFAAQRFWGTNNAWNLFDIPKFVLGLFNITSWHEYGGSMLDRAFFIYTIPTFVLMWWYKRDWFWLAIVLGLFPAMIATYISYTRYLAVVFPVFVGWAIMLDGARLRYVRMGVYAVFIGLQGVLLWRYMNFYWAG